MVLKKPGNVIMIFIQIWKKGWIVFFQPSALRKHYSKVSQKLASLPKLCPNTRHSWVRIPVSFSGWTKRRCGNFAIPVDDRGRWRRFESRQRSWGNRNTSDVTFERWTTWKIPGMKFYLSKILRFALLAIL